MQDQELKVKGKNEGWMDLAMISLIALANIILATTN